MKTNDEWYVRWVRQRQYKSIGDDLTGVPTGWRQLELVRGNKYMVSHRNPAAAQHKGAVGILVDVRLRVTDKEHIYRAVLNCCGKQFQIDPAELVPYDGDITTEHLKLITPGRKKVHLSENGKCVCKCDESQHTNPPKLEYDDFMAVPENKRCTNCNKIIRKRDRERAGGS